MNAEVHHPERHRGFAYAMFAVVVWAGWIVSGRYSMQGVLSASDVTALRFGLAGLIMLPILIRKGLRVGPWGIWGGLFLAATMGAPYNVIAFAGMKFAPTSHAALIQSVMLVMVVLLSMWLLKEPSTRVKLLGVALSVVGIVILLVAGNHVTGDKAWIGHILFIIGGVMWAIYAVFLRSWKIDPLHASAVVCVYSGLFFVPIYLLFLPSHIAQAPLDEVIFQTVYQGLINSVFALLCFNRGVAILGAATTSAFLPLVPVIATLAAIPLLHEVPSLSEWSGMLIAAAGVFLSTGIATRVWVSYRLKAEKPLGA